jgi:hypothetical protein
VRLRAGRTAAAAVEQLRDLKNELQTPRNANDEGVVVDQFRKPDIVISLKINAYLGWVQDAEVHVRYLFADAEFSDGLFGERYWHIAGLPVGSSYGTRIINQEIAYQDARLGEAIETLTAWARLGERPGELLALDANVFLQCRPYNEIPWTRLVGADVVRLVLTMPVLDEIEAKKRGQNTRLRRRARLILPRIDRAFGEDDLDYFQVERDGTPMAGVTFEILSDPSGHRRASADIDAEFLDRVEFLQQAAGRPVTVVTADTGMKIRARGRVDGLRRLTVPEEYRLSADEAQDGNA